MIDVAIIGAQMNVVRDFLDTNPSKAKTAESARLKGAVANHFEQLAQSLGFSDRKEFDAKYTNVAMEHITGLVSSSMGLPTQDVERGNFSPSGTGISGQGIVLG